MSGSSTNGSSSNASEPLSNWILAVDDVAIVINVIGLFGNLAVFITITRGGFRSRKTTIMIGHQSCVDLFVCLISIFKLITHETLNFDSGNATFNGVICFLWVNKLVYWYLVFTSVSCLVMFCVDRYLTVVRPIYYRKVKYQSYIIVICVMHFASFLFNASILVDTVDFRGGQCHHRNEDYGKTLGIYKFGTLSFRILGLLWLSYLYFIPVTILVVMYTITLRTFNASPFSRTCSEIRKKLSTQLTKSALVVTGLYIFSFSIDTVYFLLAFFNVIVLDDIKSPINRVASLFVNFHSTTPFVYCLILRLFRERLIKTVTCGRIDKTRSQSFRETTD